MFGVGSDDERIPRLRRVFDALRVAAVEVIVFGPHITDVSS